MSYSTSIVNTKNKASAEEEKEEEEEDKAEESSRRRVGPDLHSEAVDDAHTPHDHAAGALLRLLYFELALLEVELRARAFAYEQTVVNELVDSYQIKSNQIISNQIISYHIIS